MDKEHNEPSPGTSGSTASTSEATASSSEATGGSYPTCARCRNHWLKVRVKGHKRFCKYRDCTCDKCCLVAKSQKYTALQTSVWRAQAQDEALLAQQANQEGVAVTRKFPPQLDSRLKERIRDFLDSTSHGTKGGKKRVRSPSAQRTDSRLVDSSNNSLSSGGRILSAAPATDSRSLDERSDPRYSSHSSTVGTTQQAAQKWSGYSLCTGDRAMPTAPVATFPAAAAAPKMDSRATDSSVLTAPVISAAPDTDSRAVDGSCYPLSAGSRTLPTAPVTDFLSLYPSRSYATGKILPIAPIATLPTTPIVSSRPAANFRAIESDYSLSTGNRALLTASAAADTDSRAVDGGCYPFSTGGRTLPTVPVTNFLSVEGAHKALYPSLGSTSGKTLTIVPIATLPTAPIASAAPTVDSRIVESSDYSLSTGNGALLTAPVTSAAPDTDSWTVNGSCYPFPAGGRTLHTVPVTNFLSVEGSHKALYPSLSSTSSKTFPTAPSEDSLAVKRSDYSLSTDNRALLTAPVTSAPDTDSRTVDGGCYSISAGGRTLPTAPVTDFLSVEGTHKELYPSLSSTSGKTLPLPIALTDTLSTASFSAAPALDSQALERSDYSFSTGNRALLTAPFATAALGTDSRTVDRGCYPLSAGGRTLPTAPVTDFLSVEAANKALYPSFTSTSGKTLPIVPIATLPTAPISSTATAVDSRLMEGSSYSLPAGGRTLPIAPYGFAPPWMDSSPMEGGGRSLPTAFSVKTNPSQLPLWCGQEFPIRGSVTSAYNDMLLNRYYQNLSYLTKPH